MTVPRFYPQLEGMRAVASLGVLSTHVAFQTGAVSTPVLGPLLGRLDLAVALFFGLSGFLLWRPYVDAAHGAGAPRVRRYFAHRFVRIWPAYAVAAVMVLTLLPDARNADVVVWAANLTLTQIFVPLSLTAGLTQMWSLSVEVMFYLLLPVLGAALMRLSGPLARQRIPVLMGLVGLTLLWGPVASVLPSQPGLEPQNWVIGHLPWFGAGLLLAELAGRVHRGEPLPRFTAAVVELSRRRGLMFGLFVVGYGLACTPLAGPTGLGAVSSGQFVGKILLGAICGYAILAPLVLSDAATPFRFLDSPPMQALGRWSYGIFIWHVAVLAVVFGLFGILPFGGSTLTVWTLTLILSVGVASASYAFIEEPARRWLRGRERSATAGVPHTVEN
ncbi:acyltransferase [Gordonia sp. TBRC 11910]|uniref:Acyltransferase n=1 Tax=Gordonia asplenii TaxID=2725283 RepID=A0A848L078_9ACTN|nr:acyltransferase [Gordonia asplenii]NMO02475.1 acyltransferase [Gordonia asplenii]